MIDGYCGLWAGTVGLSQSLYDYSTGSHIMAKKLLVIIEAIIVG
jgi:hypothetical protein